MAFIPDEAILHMTEISSGALRLYCVLARHRNQQTGKCCPSVETCKQTMGIGRAAVYASRRDLINSDWARFDGDNVIWLKYFNPDEEMPPAQTDGFIYVVGDGFGHYKIGYTSDLEARLQTLNVGLPTDLEVIISYSTPHVRNEETRLHRQFKAKRIKGEWFALDNADLDVIRESANSPENQTQSPENQTKRQSRKPDSESTKSKPGVQKNRVRSPENKTAYKEEPAKEPAKENQQKQQRESRFSIEQIRAYIKATKKHVYSVSGLSRYLKSNADEDDLIAAWIESEKLKVKLAEKALENAARLEEFTMDDWIAGCIERGDRAHLEMERKLIEESGKPKEQWEPWMHRVFEYFNAATEAA